MKHDKASCSYCDSVVFLELKLPGGFPGKEPACQCRRHERHRFNPWVRKIPWRRKWQPLQYSCLENSMDRGAWWATVHRAKVRHDLAAKVWPYVLRVVYGHKKWETVSICYLYNQKKKTNRTNSMETGKTPLWFVSFVHVGDSPPFSFRSRGVPWKYTHMLLMFSASAPLEYHWWHADGSFFSCAAWFVGS